MSVQRGCERRTGQRARPGQTVQRIRPRESFADLRNPHKGTTTFQRFNGDPLYPGNRWDDSKGPVEFKPFKGKVKNPRYPDTTISYCRWIWSVIEPAKGKYRWDIIDGALEAARVRGQTLQVRLQPYASDDLPLWFWEMGGVRQRRPTTYGFREPDINHPAYIEHWGDLIRAFGERYDGHPGLESFDMAYGGPWGEGGGNANRRSAAKLIDVYLRSLRKTQLLSMLGTHGCAYAATKKRDIGWRADCFGDVRCDSSAGVVDGQRWNHMYDSYPREVAENGVQDAWKTAPITFETCWTVGHWYEQGWDADWILEQGYSYHLSVFMPKSCYIPEEWADKIAEFNRRMGYRFVLRQMMLPVEVKRGQRLKIPVWMENVGVAPIYRAYRFAYRFRQGNREKVVQSRQDIRRWMPGHSWFNDVVAVPASLKRGAVKLDVGLVEADTDEPKVKLAIEDIRKDGWHPLALMDVT